MRYFLCLFCFSAVLLSAGCFAFGANVPPITAAEFTDVPIVAGLNEPEAHWIWTLLAAEVVATIAGWLWLQIADRIKDSRYYTAVTAIRDAVTNCYYEYVRGIKEGRADGKLTIDEKNCALDLAYQTAVAFARTQGVDLLKVMAKETIVALIDRFVRESKTKAPAVTVPLPDLAP